MSKTIYSFKNDYSEGAHERILKALFQSNMNQEEGYCEDSFSLQAQQLIKGKIKNPISEVHFVSGGTQANLIVISAVLRPYESVIAAETGHINVHETGAIEATGHKVCVAQNNRNDGKLTIDDIKKVLLIHGDEHMVKPKLVYISNPTEIGTIYSRDELLKLYNFCKEKDLFLYVDGARLASALCSNKNDMTFEDLGKLTDVFYIGGTKCGALLGEAIVINNEKIQKEFRYSMKQHGALMAKGKILGIQFKELFTDDLYFTLGKHSNNMAQNLKEGIKSLGYKFLTESYTNQIFPILPNDKIDKLLNKYDFFKWEEINDNETAIRLVTSWATKETMVRSFIEDLKKF